MHGIIHLELHNFVKSRYGEDALKTLLGQVRQNPDLITPLRSYPDREIVEMVVAASKLTGKPIATLLEAFGEFLVSSYVALYGGLLRPEWRTLDVIEHTEETIHRVVRRRQPGALPPRLRTVRVGPKMVILTYDSPRQLCAVARGIARGLAARFGETLIIQDIECMHRNDPACIISFEVP
jgi:hypothetical protein